MLLWSLIATPMASLSARKLHPVILCTGGGAVFHVCTDGNGWDASLHVHSRELGRVTDQQSFPRQFAGFSYEVGKTWFNLRIPLYVPAIAFALLAVRSHRRHQRDASRGFEVPTVSTSPSADPASASERSP